MEESKVNKISLSTFFLILSLIVIMIMGIFIYKFYNEKKEAVEENEHLQTQISSLDETVDNLQEKINIISETINSDNSNSSNKNTTATNTDKNNSVLFTDEQVKTSLSNFLELRAYQNCDSLLEQLTEKGNLNYDPAKDDILDDGTVITKIKFSDYKNAMLNYVSESEFEKNWTSNIYFGENSNAYLTKIQGGGALAVYTVNNIKKIDNLNYTAETISITEEDESTKDDEDFSFTVKLYNDNCVIDSIKEID